MIFRSQFILGCCCVALWLGVPWLYAQQNRGMRQVHEMLLLDVDNAATKKFTTVQTHLRVGQLREAIELLQSIGDAHVGKLVAVGEGRYVNVRNYAQMLAAGLSPEGLRIYREQFDPMLKPIFEAARATGDESQLQKVLQQGYCCSFADDVLLQLGDRAWDAGDVWRARSYWEQLLPAPPPKNPGEPVAWLAYPDSDLDQAPILGRLILTSIHAGQHEDIQRELAEFARRFPQAEGRLAGREGNLLKILRDVADESKNWREPLTTSVVETFAGNPQRFQLESSDVDFGRLQWKVRLKPFGEEPRRGFLQASTGGLCYFPVVYGDLVLVNDDENIYAYSLKTGKPAWSDDTGDAAIWSGLDRGDRGNPPRGGNEALQGNIGLPRFSMTIADGRVFARMGSVQPFTGDRGGLLTCVDLAESEGKLIWETYASSVEPEVGGWIFEGSPLVIGGRVYVGMRRLNPQPQANVACFDALTGKLIWNRKLCVGQTNPNFSDFDVNQHLLTWGEGTLYYTTHMGAVAALDPRQGTIKWIVSYPRVEDTKLRHELVSRLQRGPLPALFANGVLYAAPLDSDELLAFDAETGLLKWRRSFTSPIQSLLGVAKGLVFASGPELWAVNVDTGRIAWKVGDPDPESHGFGRGLLADDLIYWPTHEEIFLINQATGGVRRRIPLFAVHGQYAGNLTMVGNHILIAQANGLAVFSDLAPPDDRSKGAKPEFSRKEAPARHPWEQARFAAQQQEWGRAAEMFRLAREAAQPDDEWMARPLADACRESEIDACLREAWRLTKSDPSAANKSLHRAIQVAKMPPTTAVLSNARVDEGQANPPQSARWRLRIPASIPDEMRAWISEQASLQLHSTAETDNGRLTPVIEAVSEKHGVQSRSVGWREVSSTSDGDGAQQLARAQRMLAVEPRQALRDLRRMTESLPMPQDRAAAWCSVARVLESQQAWGTAMEAWQKAGRAAPLETLVVDEGREVAVGDVVRGRLEQPKYVEQQLLTATSQFPAPLIRHWQQTLPHGVRTIHPEGVPPAVELACVLVDRQPVSCLNLSDGKVRWQTTFSHPLLWAGFAAEQLVLATEVELRAVAVQDGQTIWQHRLTSSDAAPPRPLREMLALECSSAATGLRSQSDIGRTDDAGALTEFSIAGSTLLVRQRGSRIQAWNALEGRLIWQFDAMHGLTPGWGVTDTHLLVGQESTGSLVLLDRLTGVEEARHMTDSTSWIRTPVMREDATILTVSQSGTIESWSRPGPAWRTDEGPRAWMWNGPISQSSVPPDVLCQGRVTLLLLDGKTLIAINSIEGNVLWKTALGTSPIAHARDAVCSDEDRVYVAASGMLRAYSLRGGAIEWERYLGSEDREWNSAVRGGTVLAYPMQATADDSLILCDKVSGRYSQRLTLPTATSAVRVYPTAHTTLVACGETLCGLGR